MRVRFSKPLPLSLIVLGGLLLRITWLLVADPAPVSDFWAYLQLGVGLLDHHQFGYPEPEMIRLPGYPVFLALLMLASRNVFWLKLFNVFLSTGLILLLYDLARQLSRGNELFAHMCALVCALYPGFIFYSPVLASENLFAPLYLGGLLLLLRGGTRWASAAVSGLVLGLAVFTRGEGLFYLPAYLLATLFSGGTLRARAMRGLSIVLCTALLLAPWYVRNFRLFGPGVGLAGSSGLNFYFSHNRYGYGFIPWPNAPELRAPNVAQAARQGWKAGLDNLWQDPVHVIRRMPVAFLQQYAPEPIPEYLLWSSVKGFTTLGGITERAEIPGLDWLEKLCRTGYLLVLILAAASFLWWRSLPGSSWAVLLSIVFGNWCCYCIIFYAVGRYRFIVEVVAFILAGLTISELARGVRCLLPRRLSTSPDATFSGW